MLLRLERKVRVINKKKLKTFTPTHKYIYIVENKTLFKNGDTF